MLKLENDVKWEDKLVYFWWKTPLKIINFLDTQNQPDQPHNIKYNEELV